MAVVGGMVASVVIKDLARKLSSSLWNEIGLLYNFGTDLEDMKGTLDQLTAFMEDVGQLQPGRDYGKSMTVWLDRLMVAIEDTGNLLSSYESDIKKKRETSSDSLKQILLIFFSKPKAIIMAHKLRGMRNRLNKIGADQKLCTNFVGSDEREDIIKQRTTNSVLDLGIIVGREEEKEELVHLLHDTDDQGDLGIIPIVGFGGLGKTTLARLVFNDRRLDFNLKAWVYVSMKFDFKKIVENLIECITGAAGISYNAEEGALKKLLELLSGKKFLIVLDDLWEENWQNLDKIKAILHAGIKGSKVILTTRNEKIAISLSVKPHFINLLSDEDCWVLFSERAFGSHIETADEELVEIGKQIAKKCKGVPLSAQALGAIMHFKVGVGAWKSVRDSNVWNFEGNTESFSSTNPILSSLELTYYNMPSCLKICFAYCSIFPKGFRIEKLDLIQQWIALGFIQKIELGQEYIDKLLWISFLQNDYEIGYLMMHDLVHDLATFIAGDAILVCEEGKQNNKSNGFTQYVRMVDYMDSLIRSKTLPQSMKTLHFENCRPMKLEDKILSKAKYLRLLSFISCEMSVLSTSLIHLKRLRYLKCYKISITTLPDSLGNLHDLQILHIWSCPELRTISERISGLISLTYLRICDCTQLTALPRALCDLKLLEYLAISYCDQLESLPRNMNRLTSLNTLYIVGSKELVLWLAGEDWHKRITDVNIMLNTPFSVFLDATQKRGFMDPFRHMSARGPLKSALDLFYDSKYANVHERILSEAQQILKTVFEAVSTSKPMLEGTSSSQSQKSFDPLNRSDVREAMPVIGLQILKMLVVLATSKPVSEGTPSSQYKEIIDSLHRPDVREKISSNALGMLCMVVTFSTRGHGTSSSEVSDLLNRPDFHEAISSIALQMLDTLLVLVSIFKPVSEGTSSSPYQKIFYLLSCSKGVSVMEDALVEIWLLIFSRQPAVQKRQFDVQKKSFDPLNHKSGGRRLSRKSAGI